MSSARRATDLAGLLAAAASAVPADSVTSASSLAAGGDTTRMLPVTAALRPLLPGGGLRRGSTVTITRAHQTTGGDDPPSGATLRAAATRAAAARSASASAEPVRPAPGASLRSAGEPAEPVRPAPGASLRSAGEPAVPHPLRPGAPRLTPLRTATPVPQSARWGGTSLMLALLAEASRAGSWCAIVGLPELGVAAAAELGVALERLALVPQPGAKWQEVVAALLDGFDLVVVAVREPVTPQAAGRLSARARQRGSVLLPMGPWDSADLVLEPVGAVWRGLGSGHGRLKCRHLTIAARGRGAAARPREVDVWLPASSGGIQPHTVEAADTDEHRSARGHLRAIAGG